MVKPIAFTCCIRLSQNLMPATAAEAKRLAKGMKLPTSSMPLASTAALKVIAGSTTPDTSVLKP